MESAHLTKAHEYVRDAATATYGSSIATAGQQHELAAASFGTAASDTHNAEALRILGLLENHHSKLASLIKEHPRKDVAKKKEEVTNKADSSPTSPPHQASEPRSDPPSMASSPRAPLRRRLPQSSIASNLAAKRGIPGPHRGQPSSAPVSVTNALAGPNDAPSTPVRDMLERQNRKAQTSNKGKDSQHEDKISNSHSSLGSSRDESFKRFYSTMGGYISALTAPLAFTSLPLNGQFSSSSPEAPLKKEDKPQKPKSRIHSPEASRTVKSSEPDLAALISKPALRALREEGISPFATNESFFLVPTSGGTVSYANILQNPNSGPHHHMAQNPHLDPISEGDAENFTGLRSSSHEEFVDAREEVGPPSPISGRRPLSRGNSSTGGKLTTTTTTSSSNTPRTTLPAGRGTGAKTLEELELENETLKHLLNKSSKRLAMWETTSQSSYSALAQSFRTRKSPSSDPAALAQALAMGANAIPPSLPSPPISSAAPSSTKISTTSHTTSNAQANTSKKDDNAHAQRIAELEALLATQQRTIADLTRQNERNTAVLGRYREQWEKLKAGARKKELERRERRLAANQAGSVVTTAGVGEEGAGQGNGSGDGELGAVEGEGLDGMEEPGFGKA